jgi:hemoglobin-like flavoprotein
MTNEQINLVKTSFEKVAPQAETVAALFYKKLFELDPSLRHLFQGDIREQGRKLMQMIGLAVKGLDRLDELVPTVQALGKRHSAYGVQAHHYETVGNALLWTLEKGLDADFTAETKAAWIAVYSILAQTMNNAAHRPAENLAVAV